jgi:hypothetical protein|tara:strand:- start:333 stop:488 length:156 start_codon:yes stop_codon:yes gene_type:complete
VRDRLRKELFVMYRSADVAYGALDFEGLGYITENAFLGSIIVRERVPFSID